MLCTLVWDVYANSERTEILAAMRRLVPRHSRDWSRKGVYSFWDPGTRELLYVGLATNLPQRFAQHNGLVAHSGGNKLQQINRWFSVREKLGITLMIQGAAVQILEDVKKISPMIGAEARGITQIAEGQLIELCKQQTGRRPPWNIAGGSVRGGGWAKPSPRSVIRLLSAADESLFVARRSLRALVNDRRALQIEALLHAARMHALGEIHGMNFNFGADEAENIERIKRMLMLVDGKLIDNLDASDDRIRHWVHRFADLEDMRADRVENMQRMQKLAAESDDDADRASAAFLGEFMEIDGDLYNARIAFDILESGYLDEKPSWD